MRRRRERLEGRLRGWGSAGGRAAKRGASVHGPGFDANDLDELDQAPEQEVEDAEARILYQATAGRSIAELKAEIETLKGLEALALEVRRAGWDTKWLELAGLW